jgi:hypothetical protein
MLADMLRSLAGLQLTDEDGQAPERKPGLLRRLFGARAMSIEP